MSILFINGSPNKDGNTVGLAKTALSNKDYDTLNLVDYKFCELYGLEYLGLASTASEAKRLEQSI